MKKKILFVVNHEVVIYNFRLELVERLIKEGFEVHVSCPYGPMIDKLEALGCIPHEAVLNRHSIHPLMELKVIRNYQRLIHQLHPDVILTYTIKPNLYMGLIARYYSIPIIANITGLGNTLTAEANKIMKQLLKRIYRVSLRRAHIIYFQNQSNLEIFQKHKMLNGRYGLLPGSGVNTERFNYLDYPKGETIHLYYFGRMMRAKGVWELLGAAKEIIKQQHNVRFHFVGFSEEADLEKELKKAESTKQIFYHGFSDNVPALMKEAHAVILPSYHEGMSNVLLEASASGRPIIASDIPGCKEIIENNITGLLFEPRSAAEIIASINKFLDLSPQEKVNMGKRGREKVVNEFSRNYIVEQYIKEINLLTSKESEI